MPGLLLSLRLCAQQQKMQQPDLAILSHRHPR
jgi:hypothetical protein